MSAEYQLVSHINLLPWREERRGDLRREFFSFLSLSVVMAGALWFGAREYHVQLQDHQNERIQYVQDRIAVLEEEIAELEQLQEAQERLLSRIRSIEQLQSNRSLVVHLFDEIVTSVPTEISISALEQSGNVVKLTGAAQSNASVSALMRNIESSQWLQDPELILIEKQMADLDSQPKVALLPFDETALKEAPERYVELSRFELKFKQVVSSTDEDAQW